MRLENAIHIWHIQAPLNHTTMLEFYKTLAPEEEVRYHNYLQQKDKDNFLIGRGALRTILSTYFPDISPQQFAFKTNSFGKPYLHPDRAWLDNIEFNISHSGNKVLLALSHPIPLGIDIEFINPQLNFQELIPLCLSEHERTALHTFPSERQSALFFNCWVQKEALVKAMGSGLSYPITDITLQLDKTQGSVVQLMSPQDGSLKAFRVFNLSIDPLYASALAFEYREDPPPLHIHNLSTFFRL